MTEWPFGFGRCHCGCGGETPRYTETVRRKGQVRGKPCRYLPNHQLRGSGNPNWNGRRCIFGGGYVGVHMATHPRAHANGYVFEHVLVAERALGRPLPEAAQVHHLNGVKTDNRPSNLVICENDAYHKLLHQRQRALDACGHAGWWRCEICKQYDAPERLSGSARRARHRSCMAAYGRARYHKRKEK